MSEVMRAPPARVSLTGSVGGWSSRYEEIAATGVKRRSTWCSILRRDHTGRRGPPRCVTLIDSGGTHVSVFFDGRWGPVVALRVHSRARRLERTWRHEAICVARSPTRMHSVPRTRDRMIYLPRKSATMNALVC